MLSKKQEQTNSVARQKNFNSFLVMWVGEMISSIGSGLSAFGISVFVFQMTKTATSVSLVTFFSFVPAIVLSPFAGLLADRYNRRFLMIIGDLFSAGILLVMWLLMINDTIQLWQICFCIGINSAFVSLIDPCYRATITDLLTEADYARASGLIQLASSAKFLLAPLIAGFFLVFTSVTTLIMLDIVTIFFTIGTLAYVKKNTVIPKLSREINKNVLEDLKVGWDVISQERGILTLILVMSAVTLFVGFVETLFTPMLLTYIPVQTLGLIQSIGAVGMLISSIATGVFNANQHIRKNMIISLGFAGIFISLVGVTTNVILIALLLFLFFFTLPFINTGMDVLIRNSVSNETQGRVWGLVSVISQLGYVVAYGLSGVLADYLFNPLLKGDGYLANSIGLVIGTGASRGIGLMFILIGLSIVLVTYCLNKSKDVKQLEKNRMKRSKI